MRRMPFVELTVGSYIDRNLYGVYGLTENASFNMRVKSIRSVCFCFIVYILFCGFLVYPLLLLEPLNMFCFYHFVIAEKRESIVCQGWGYTMFMLVYF